MSNLEVICLIFNDVYHLLSTMNTVSHCFCIILAGTCRNFLEKIGNFYFHIYIWQHVFYWNDRNVAFYEKGFSGPSDLNLQSYTEYVRLI